MLPPLPNWPIKSSGWRSGGALNMLIYRIKRQVLLSSATVKISDLDRGQQIDIVGAQNASGVLRLGFAVSCGAGVQVASGRVVSSTWAGIDGSSPEPGDWTVEANFTGAVLASTATAVWLQIQFAQADEESEGILGIESIDISGSAGGRGGGGGGGGASTGDSSTQYSNPGVTGADGDLGGAGGAGGLVALIVDNSPVGGTTEGVGADGGEGGDGGAGGDGSAVTFTRATKAVAQIRRWTLSGISAHATKGTASETSTWIKLATISGNDVTQHHIGVLHVSPPAITFIET